MPFDLQAECDVRRAAVKDNSPVKRLREKTVAQSLNEVIPATLAILETVLLLLLKIRLPAPKSVTSISVWLVKSSVL